MDKFIKGVRRIAGTIDSSGIINDSVDNFGLSTGSGLPEGELVCITIDRVNSSGEETPTLEEVIIGEVDGDRLINVERGVAGTAQPHSSGATWECRLTAAQYNRMIDGILEEHNQDGSHKVDSPGMLEVMSALNPIGTIREFNVSTNPATLLGFGTWSAFGTGRVTVAIDTGQTEFDTNGETGGAKTHTLTKEESGLPAHGHTVKVSGSSTAGYSALFRNNSNDGGASSYVENHAGANASSAHNNLQPYIVVYRWVRTA